MPVRVPPVIGKYGPPVVGVLPLILSTHILAHLTLVVPKLYVESNAGFISSLNWTKSFVKFTTSPPATKSYKLLSLVSDI